MQTIEFYAPFKDLGFPGTPFRSIVLLQPTSRCLVNIKEWPPFVITLELVHLSMVKAIPINMLHRVKNWLNSCDISYPEGIQPLKWTNIMKTITDGPSSSSKVDPKGDDETSPEKVEEEEEDDDYESSDVYSEGSDYPEYPEESESEEEKLENSEESEK
jgi:nucleosome binding factor SPN SPT16 subunit